MPTDSYLLDTSVASVAWSKSHRSHSEVRGKLRKLGKRHVHICVITLAEVEYGLKTAPTIDEAKQNEVRKRMAGYKIYSVDKHTVREYSDIRAELFKKYSRRKKGRGFVAKRVSELRERTSDKELGIQENDLWIASVALNHNLVLITADKKMKRLLEIAEKFDLRYEIWQID